MRRTTKTLAALSVAALALTSCGGDSESSSDGTTELRVAWWGGDTRHERTLEMIEVFEREHPDITINPEYRSWDDYWTHISTQTAAGSPPDVMQMDLAYIREYIDNGVLLELDDIDTSGIPDELLSTGSLEGSLYGAPAGSSVPAIVTNVDLFEEAGLEVPDDDTWTWDDLVEAGQAVQQDTDAFGVAASWSLAGTGTAAFELWLRQHNGTDFYDESGEILWDEQDAVEYFEFIGEMVDEGALPPASQIVEDQSATFEQSLIATSGAAMDSWFDTNLVSLTYPEDTKEVQLLKYPSVEGSAEEAEIYYKASMFYSATTGTEHPEAAQEFIDFMINNEEAGAIQGTDRGVPSNADVREAIAPDLDEVQQKTLEFSESVEDVVAPAPPIPPSGFGAVHPIMQRYEQEFLFERLTAEEAASAMFEEIQQVM